MSEIVTFRVDPAFYPDYRQDWYMGITRYLRIKPTSGVLPLPSLTGAERPSGLIDESAPFDAMARTIAKAYLRSQKLYDRKLSKLVDGFLRVAAEQGELPEEFKRQQDARLAELERRSSAHEHNTNAKRNLELLKSIVDQMGRRYSPERVSLDNFTCAHKEQQQILDQVRAHSERLLEAIEQGENILLYGTPGTGKDHILAALLHIAAGKLGCRCNWMSGNDFFHAVRGSGMDAASWRTICTADVLAMSDPLLPASDPTNWCIDEFHRLIDNRYNHMRPTWITVNVHKPEELAERFSSQTWDRFREGAKLFPCFWPSFRGTRDAA